MPSNTSAPSSIICANCGLPNIPERRTCKRCQSLLQPTEQEQRQIAAEAQRNRRSWLGLIPLLVVGTIMVTAFTIKVLKNEPWMPTPGGIIDLRADRVGILRMATKTPPEDITIHDDGEVTRFAYPAQSSRVTRLTLTAAERQEFDQFRTQWCQQVPTFRAIAPNEPFYDLGIRCGGYTVKQAKVPIDMVPSFFAKLLRRLP